MPTDPVNYLAQQAADDPHFLGHHLWLRGLDLHATAAALGLSLADVRLLWLCRAPRETLGSPEWSRDVESVERRFGVPCGRLGALLGG